MLKTDIKDPHNLQRFLDAQASIYEEVLSELRSGRKQGHWMWFIFPQIRGLGISQTSRWFAIASKLEAEAYLRHSVLGPRLLECTQLVILVEGRSSETIFGQTDNMKFRSCMSLFYHATSDNIFGEAIEKYFGGKFDQSTVDRL